MGESKKMFFLFSSGLLRSKGQDRTRNLRILLREMHANHRREQSEQLKASNNDSGLPREKQEETKQKHKRLELIPPSQISALLMP